MTLQEALYEECYKRQFELYEYSKIRDSKIIDELIPDFWDNIRSKIDKTFIRWSDVFNPKITIKLDLITLIFYDELIEKMVKNGSCIVKFTKVEIIENK